MDKANAEFPPFPKWTVESGAVHTAFFFSAPGSVYWATKSGTWGDARQATVEMGERYLQIAADATLAVLDDIEKTFKAMPVR
jgi:creatinine amidohydrolase/Fe(II)-dependent formamide hydrolase-like protein